MKTLCGVISGNIVTFPKNGKAYSKKHWFLKKKKKKEKMEVCTSSMQKYQRSVVVIPNLWGLL